MMFSYIIGPILILCAGNLLHGWSDLRDDDKNSLLSFKEQLALECQFHPSMLIRFLLRWWERIVQKGEHPHCLAWIIPWSLPCWELRLEDLYLILREIGSQHPTSLPWGGLIRWVCVLSFSIIIDPNFINFFELIFIFFPLAGLCYESWCWGQYKQQAIVMRWWRQQAHHWMILNDTGMPIPVFIAQKSDVSLWVKMMEMNPDLHHTSSIFQSYYSKLQHRRHRQQRQFWSLLLDLCTLWLFTSISSSLLQNFYHASF